MFDTTLTRVTVEFASTVICIVLVKFMIKPYQLTKESRYLGLPLGFGFLGTSFTISAIVYFLKSNTYYMDLLWFQSLMLAFAFVFLAATYHFSKELSQNSRFLSEITFGLLIAVFVALFAIVFATPLLAPQFYRESQTYIRIFNMIFLSYIAAHTLRSHIDNPDPTTIWIPLGFILLAISQYSSIFWYTDLSLAAFFGEMAVRTAGLSLFLFVSYRTFYSSGKLRKEV